MVIYDSCSATPSPRKVSWLEVSQTISRTVTLIPAKHNFMESEPVFLSFRLQSTLYSCKLIWFGYDSMA